MMKPNKKQIAALTVMLGGDLISHFADKLSEHVVFNSHRKLDNSLVDEVDQFADGQMQIGDQQPVKATGTYEDGTAMFHFDQATLDQMNQHPDEPVNINLSVSNQTSCDRSVRLCGWTGWFNCFND